MKRFAEWNRDVRTDAITLLLMLLIGHIGSDVTTVDPTEDPAVDEWTGNSTEFWVNGRYIFPTVEPLSSFEVNETGSRRSRHRNRGDEETLNCWMDDTNCTMEDIVRQMTDGNGVMPLPCQSQHLTISRQIPSPARQNRREWTNTYSFSLSTLNRNVTILNASIQFPVSLNSTGNWSSIRIAIDVQLIGDRAAIFRGHTSQRFRRKLLPTQLCFRVSDAAAIVQSLVNTGSGSLVSNIRVTIGGVVAHSLGGAAEEHNRKPVMTVNALSQGPCSAEFWNSFPQSVP